MWKLHCRLAALVSLCGIASWAWAVEPIRVDIQELAKNESNLIGRLVVTHGCLVNTPHGSFIEPCGSDNHHDLVLVLDPKHKGAAAFEELGINFASHVEADFAGVLVERSVRWPTAGKRIFLRLDSVANGAPYGP